MTVKVVSIIYSFKVKEVKQKTQMTVKKKWHCLDDSAMI